MFPYRVIYVENDLDTQKDIQNVLSNYFENVKVFSDGQEALNMIKTSVFDLVITTINIPHITGFTLVAEVKKINPFIPVVIVVSYCNYEILARAIETGVDGYIIKPISSEKFMSKILQMIDKIDFVKHSHHNENLLKQYKEAIDRSSIVSKTDINGKITYVNESFCSTSGYKKDELLGKSHNIIRHPDMPSCSFKNMWETIQSKKPWSGIIKNRKKDGSAYYVKSLVNPILNDKGELAEYIAIRNDISELEMYKQELEKKLQESVEEVIETQKEIIYTVGNIGEKRSEETGLHVRRVANYSYLLAKLYGLSDKEAELIKFASPMHDIGKIAIPDSVLHKPGALNDEEWEIIKTHSRIGYEMLKFSKRDLLKAAAIIAHEHHERYDGNGYPNQLQGKDIHIFGRITTIVDVYDALSNDRVYKKKWDLEQILELFRKEKGKQFDPHLTDLFLSNIEEFEKLKIKLI
jgi:PAS domain S-box-containing protein